MIGRLTVLSAVVVVCGACTPQPRVFTDDLVELPDLLGEPVRTAIEELEDRGFIVEVVEDGTDRPVDCPDGTVTAQDPAPGEDVLKAATVTLTAAGCGEEGP